MNAFHFYCGFFKNFCKQMVFPCLDAASVCTVYHYTPNGFPAYKGLKHDECKCFLKQDYNRIINSTASIYSSVTHLWQYRIPMLKYIQDFAGLMASIMTVTARLMKKA